VCIYCGGVWLTYTLLVVVLDLGKAVKDAVQKQGFLAWQYNTIGVSDGITQGNDGRLSLY